MGRPQISVGRAVKVYVGPDYGRQDAIAMRVDNATGVIDANAVKTGKVYRNLVYKDALGDTVLPMRGYWVELPEGYVAGSEGH
jgi:hypothetical protein